MRLPVIAACLVLSPLAPGIAAAQSGCAGISLFQCQSGSKAIDLCLAGDVAVYRYGPAGRAAELVLERHVTEVDLQPWNGVGRYLWEELTLHNAGYSYALNYSVDRMAQGDPQVTGGVTVAKGGQVLAEVQCSPGTVGAHDFYPVFERKEANGQCWNLDSHAWQRC